MVRSVCWRAELAGQELRLHLKRRRVARGGYRNRDHLNCCKNNIDNCNVNQTATVLGI